jgi:hypothetical protein
VFACDTNAGIDRLLMSFELAESRSGVTGVDFVMTVTSSSPLFPAWWAFRNPGTCRQLSASLLTVKPVSSTHCMGWDDGQVSVASTTYTINASAPAQGRFAGTLILSATGIADFDGGAEYFLAMFDFNHQRTVGTGACGGCSIPVCITFDYATLRAGQASDWVLLNQGANGSASRIVGWQSGFVSSYQPAGSVDGVFYGPSVSCIPGPITRAAPSTWSGVKALYR